MSMAGPDGASAAGAWARRVAPAAATHATSSARTFFIVSPSTCRAPGWMPARRAGLAPVMRARPVRRGEVLGIDDLRRHEDERLATGNVQAIEVLGHDGAGAVGDAILPQVPRLHVRRHHLQRATGQRRPAAV